MRTSFAAFSLLALTACGGSGDEATANGAGGRETRNQAIAAAERAAGPAAAAQEAAAPKPSYTLAANGLDPGLTFGMNQADAIAAAANVFGPGGAVEHNDECGEGPMDFVSFGGLQLGFQEGKLAGWSLSEDKPPLRTKSGLTVGSPRSALGGLEIDEESTLGPEFDSDGVGGILDEKGERVVALWAGYPCQFR